MKRFWTSEVRIENATVLNGVREQTIKANHALFIMMTTTTTTISFVMWISLMSFWKSVSISLCNSSEGTQHFTHLRQSTPVHFSIRKYFSKKIFPEVHVTEATESRSTFHQKILQSVCLLLWQFGIQTLTQTILILSQILRFVRTITASNPVSKPSQSIDLRVFPVLRPCCKIAKKAKSSHFSCSRTKAKIVRSLLIPLCLFHESITYYD